MQLGYTIDKDSKLILFLATTFVGAGTSFLFRRGWLVIFLQGKYNPQEKYLVGHC